MRYKYLLPLLTRLNYKLLGKHPLYAQPSDISCSPFFILGSGRNGSTLLSMILNGHSKIFIPNEQFALHYAAIRFQLYNFLIWRDIVKIVIGEFADSNNNQAWNTNFNELYHQIYSIKKGQRTFQKIIDEIIKEVALQNKETFSIWGDKSPPTTHFIKYIYRVYPNSKYIFLIRDGRDVVSSYKEGGHLFNEMSKVQNSVISWKESIANWKWLQKKVEASKLLEIKYEDLVKEPEFTIKRILLFLGMKYENGMLEFKNVIKKRDILQMPYHQGLNHPINKDSIGKWESQLKDNELNYIMPLIENELKEYNYL